MMSIDWNTLQKEWLTPSSDSFFPHSNGMLSSYFLIFYPSCESYCILISKARSNG
jgi:hypothetical protein